MTSRIFPLSKGVALAFAGIVGALALGTDATAQTASDPFANYCRADAPVTLFLIDQTEAYDEVDRTRLAEGAIAVMNGLWAGERFEIYTVDNKPGNMTPRVSLCIPGCPEEYDRATPIWQQRCNRVVIERDKRGFQVLFAQTLRDYLNAGRATPGTELLRTFSQLSGEFRGRSLRKLVIFSDMIEYSSLSQRVSSFEEKDIEPLLKRTLREAPIGETFAGVPVEAFGFGKWLGQQDKPDRPDLPFSAAQAIRSFWERYFNEQAKASNTRVTLNY